MPTVIVYPNSGGNLYWSPNSSQSPTNAGSQYGVWPTVGYDFKSGVHYRAWFTWIGTTLDNGTYAGAIVTSVSLILRTYTAASALLLTVYANNFYPVPDATPGSGYNANNRSSALATFNMASNGADATITDADFISIVQGWFDESTQANGFQVDQDTQHGQANGGNFELANCRLSVTYEIRPKIQMLV